MSTFLQALRLYYFDIITKLYTKLISRFFYGIGKNSSIIPPLRTTYAHDIQLGNNVTIHSNCWLQVVNYREAYSSPKLVFMDHVSIGMDSTISVAKRIVIEEHVFTARNVYISDHGHEFHNHQIPISQQGITDPEEVIIGAHSWLGQNAVILPGVKIGRHCVIGANSVVNRSIPDYSVAVGVPARVVKRFDFDLNTWERLNKFEQDT